MLRYVRPRSVVVEVVPGFWNPRTPHLGALLDELRTIPYLLEGKELDMEPYLPQKRKRGVLVFTRWDQYRMPARDNPGLAAVAWPTRPPTGTHASTLLLHPDDARLQDDTLQVGPVELLDLSPHRRNPSWPSHPAFSRVLGTLAWTIMKSYARTTAFPYPWMGQITQSPRGGFRWLHPRELARLQGLPDTALLPEDRDQASEWVGDALPPLAAGWFLLRALYTLHRDRALLQAQEASFYHCWTETNAESRTTPREDDTGDWDPQSPATPPGTLPARTRVICLKCNRALPATTRRCNCPGAADDPVDLTHHIHTRRRWGDAIPYGFLLHLLPGGKTRWKRVHSHERWCLPGGPCPDTADVRDWIRARMSEDAWKCRCDRPHYWSMVDQLWGFKVYLVLVLPDEWQPAQATTPSYVPLSERGSASQAIANRYPEMTRPLGLIPSQRQGHDPHPGTRIGEASHPGPEDAGECNICHTHTTDAPFWCTHFLCRRCLQEWNHRVDHSTLACPECRRPEDMDELLRGNRRDLLELPKLAWALVLSQRGGARRLGIEFPADRWVPTPLPAAPPRYGDDVADWTWPLHMAEWAWTQHLHYWRTQPPDDLLEAVGAVAGRSALALGPVPWIFGNFDGTEFGPGQPLLIHGEFSPTEVLTWQVFPWRSQWWHWVAWAATGHLGGDRYHEHAPADIWRTISQACHPQFPWHVMARLFRRTFREGTHRHRGPPALAPVTGLMNLWTGYEQGLGWKLATNFLQRMDILALRTTARGVLNDMCGLPIRPSLRRERLQARAATKAWLRGVMRGHTGGCPCLRQKRTPAAWWPPKPPQWICPCCHQPVFRWHIPWQTLATRFSPATDYLYEAWNQTWLLILGWRDVGCNPFTRDLPPGVTDGRPSWPSGAPVYGDHNATPGDYMQIVAREFARRILAIDLRSPDLRDALSATLDPEPWPTRSLDRSGEQDMEEYYYEEGRDPGTHHAVHVWTVRWRLLLGKHVDPLGCLPPRLVDYLIDKLIPYEPAERWKRLWLQARANGPLDWAPLTLPLVYIPISWCLNASQTVAAWWQAKGYLDTQSNAHAMMASREWNKAAEGVRRWAESEPIHTYGGLGRPDDPERPEDLGLCRRQCPTRSYPNLIRPLFRTATEARDAISSQTFRVRDDYDPYQGCRVGEAAHPGPRFVAAPTAAASPLTTHGRCAECEGLLPHEASGTTHRCMGNATGLPDSKRYWCAFCDTYIPTGCATRHHVQACRRALPTRWLGVPTQRQQHATGEGTPDQPDPPPTRVATRSRRTTLGTTPRPTGPRRADLTSTPLWQAFHRGQTQDGGESTHIPAQPAATEETTDDRQQVVLPLTEPVTDHNQERAPAQSDRTGEAGEEDKCEGCGEPGNLWRRFPCRHAYHRHCLTELGPDHDSCPACHSGDGGPTNGWEDVSPTGQPSDPGGPDVVCTAAWAAALGAMSTQTRQAWLTHENWGVPVGVVEATIRRHLHTLLGDLCSRFHIREDQPAQRQLRLFRYLLGRAGLPRRCLEGNLSDLDWERAWQLLRDPSVQANRNNTDWATALLGTGTAREGRDEPQDGAMASQRPAPDPRAESARLTASQRHGRQYRHGVPAGYRGQRQDTDWSSYVTQLSGLDLHAVLLRPFRPIRHIPRRCLPMIGNIVRETAFMATSGSEQNRELGARLWALLPRMLLASAKTDTSTSKGDSGPTHQGVQIRQEVERRLAKFLAGEWLDLLPPTRPLSTPSTDPPDGPAQAAECIKNVQMGLLARGMACLNSAPIAPADEVTFEATKNTLRAHAERPPDPDLGISLRPHVLEVQEAMVADLIRRSKMGVSPGIVGWRNEHFKALATMPHVLTGLTRMVAVVAGGYTPRSLLNVMLLDKVTPLLKDIGAPEGSENPRPRKVRPIEGKDTLRKLSTRVAYEMEKDDVAQALRPYQMAVGVPGGAEVMSKAAQAAADAFDLAIIKIDGTSAFNLQDRRVAFQAMHRVAPLTATALGQFYQKTSEKLIQVGDHYKSVFVNSGWEQGDPGAPPGFSFGMDVSLRQLATWLEVSLATNMGPHMRDSYRLWSYLDDLVVAVPASMVNHTMHYATTALEKSGYIINWGKLEIYAKVGPPPWLPDPLHSEAPEARRDVPNWTSKWTTDGVILLGADQLEPGTTGFQPRPPVWIGSVDFHDRTCQAVLRDISTLTDHLDTLLQHAPDRAPALSIVLLLFRLCVHSKLVYTLRSAYSVGILRLSTQLDSHFQAKLREWIDLPDFDSPLATYLLEAPLRHGGLGITSLRKLAPEAYIGSWGLVLSAVQKQVGNHRYPVSGRTQGSPTTAQLATTAALEELPEGVLDVEAAAQHPVPKLQKKN